jgi:hypothetical protein
VDDEMVGGMGNLLAFSVPSSCKAVDVPSQPIFATRETNIVFQPELEAGLPSALRISRYSVL